jgi:diguanylate cyclase
MAPFHPLPPSVQQALLAQALASTANAVFIADIDGRFVWINPAFSKLSGYSEAEALGKSTAIVHASPPGDGEESLRQALQAGQPWHGELIEKHKDGRLYTVDEVVTPLSDERGAITHFIAVQHDVTALKQSAAQEHHLANHDSLTGLANRGKFLREQQKALARAEREGTLVATLFVDLDHFKPVNDAYGHDIGDQLLAAVSERLCAAVRQGDLVSRCGGDEFSILLAQLPNASVAVALARKLVNTVGKPFILRGHHIAISASIGIAIFPTDGIDGLDLLRNADRAMYLVKRDGGNNVRVCRNNE